VMSQATTLAVALSWTCAKQMGSGLQPVTSTLAPWSRRSWVVVRLMLWLPPITIAVLLV
jgi:hypothetical protein